MSSDTFSYSTINFGEPEPLANKRSTILAVVITFMFFSWTCVASRLWVRFKVIRDPGWDDFCVVMYLLTTTSGSVSLLVGTEYGLGKHFLTIPLEDKITWSKVSVIVAAPVPRSITDKQRQTFYVANAAYCTSTAFIKLALLLQYLRVYPKGSLMHRACMATVGLTALWGLVYSFISWFPCFPVNHVWELKPDAKCYGYGSSRPSEFSATYESHTAINMILDVIVLIIPMPLLFKEGTGSAQRLRIGALLFMGNMHTTSIVEVEHCTNASFTYSVIALAIWRLQTILEHKAATVPTRDPTWYGPITMLLAVLEVDAAAVCASVPIFWPVLSNKLGGIFVTQEIEIRRETRFFQMDDAESGLDGGQRVSHGPVVMSNGGAGGRGSQPHSRTGSEVELKQHDGDSKQATSFTGSYSMKSMDPLALPPLDEPPLNSHEATVQAPSRKNGWKRI
ncbi:uncharacterized protein PG986_007712 [Apiospora aurea]|uniref:Rhodopsin domain-containing protein n=1 Tax=Apiospora aurea TaxID=335848 RepID=A0ABR1QDD1_9PEZI